MSKSDTSKGFVRYAKVLESDSGRQLSHKHGFVCVFCLVKVMSLINCSLIIPTCRSKNKVTPSLWRLFMDLYVDSSEAIPRRHAGSLKLWIPSLCRSLGARSNCRCSAFQERLASLSIRAQSIHDLKEPVFKNTALDTLLPRMSQQGFHQIVTRRN